MNGDDRAGWEFFAPHAGPFCPSLTGEENWEPPDRAALWVSLWEGVARNSGAGERGARLVAEAAGERFGEDIMCPESANEILNFIRSTVHA